MLIKMDQPTISTTTSVIHSMKNVYSRIYFNSDNIYERYNDLKSYANLKVNQQKC